MGGWARSYAALNFAAAAATSIGFLLSEFVDAVDDSIYVVGFLISLSIALIVLFGFIVFFEGFALILGIVGTIIGILIGVRKLRGR